MSENRPRSGLLNDEVARNRRRTAGLAAELGKSTGSESGGGSGGGGNKDFTEALLLAAMSSSVGRGGLSNSGAIVRASAYHVLRKRRLQSTGESFFAEEHVALSPNITLGTLGMVQKVDARVAAQALGTDVRQAREVQRNLSARDVEAALRADYDTGRIEQAARTAMQGTGSDPGSSPEQIWKRGLDENADLGRMNHRELALHLLSAANSNEPGASDAQNLFAEQLADKGNKHEPFAFSIQANEIVGAGSSARSNPNSVMAGASWQADLNPIPIEDYFNRVPALPNDRRASLNLQADSARTLITAVQDGRVPASHLITLTDNAKRNVPGFQEKYDEARARDRQQGDAVMYAYNSLSGFSMKEPRDLAQDRLRVNAGGADLRAQDPSVLADPSVLLNEGAGIHKSVGQLTSGLKNLNASAIARPDVQAAEAAETGKAVRTDGRDARATAGSSNLRYPRGEDVRAKHRDGQGMRLGRVEVERRNEVRQGNRHSRSQREGYHRGATVGSVHGDSKMPQGRLRKREAVARAMHQTNSRRRTAAQTTTVTTTTRRGAAR